MGKRHWWRLILKHIHICGCCLTLHLLPPVSLVIFLQKHRFHWQSASHYQNCMNIETCHLCAWHASSCYELSRVTAWLHLLALSTCFTLSTSEYLPGGLMFAEFGSIYDRLHSFFVFLTVPVPLTTPVQATYHNCWHEPPYNLKSYPLFLLFALSHLIHHLLFNSPLFQLLLFLSNASIWTQLTFVLLKGSPWMTE